jgi:RimJ/RimL family protein N-acetyltransferase
MLRGERVSLRTIQREDLGRLADLYDDLELRSLVSDRPPAPESRAAWEADFDRNLIKGEGASDSVGFAIEVEGEIAGRCGLHKIDRYSQVCELGIWLGRDYWGKGFGSDAVGILLDYAFRHLNLHKVCLEVLADDERAVGAYRKVGFVEEGRLREQAWHNGTYRDTLRMAVLRSPMAEAGDEDDGSEDHVID